MLFMFGYDGETHIPHTLDDLVEDWLLHNKTDRGTENLQVCEDLVISLSMSQEFHPICWQFILRVVNGATTIWQAIMIAAGPLEDIIAISGIDYIDQIEAEARSSVRFRFVLTGVWQQGRTDPEVWARVEAARANMKGHGIDDGAELPPISMS